MPSKELRFALDEKGLKNLAPSLVGRTISYWEDDTTLSRGVVRSADIERDRYGNPFIRVDIEGPGAVPAPPPPAAGPAPAAPAPAAPPEGEAAPAS